MDSEVKAVLTEAFPDEVDLLGDELVDQLLTSEDPSTHLDLPGDDRFDLAPVYDFLKAASKYIDEKIRERDQRKRDQTITTISLDDDDFSFKWIGADDAGKKQAAEAIPRIIAILEARSQAKSATAPPG